MKEDISGSKETCLSDIDGKVTNVLSPRGGGFISRISMNSSFWHKTVQKAANSIRYVLSDVEQNHCQKPSYLTDL